MNVILPQLKLDSPYIEDYESISEAIEDHDFQSAIYKTVVVNHENETSCVVYTNSNKNHLHIYLNNLTE